MEKIINLIQFIYEPKSITLAVITLLTALGLSHLKTKLVVKKFAYNDKVKMREAFSELQTKVSEYKTFKADNMKVAAIKPIELFLTLSPTAFHQTLKELLEAMEKKDFDSITKCQQQLNDIYSGYKYANEKP